MRNDVSMRWPLAVTLVLGLWFGLSYPSPVWAVGCCMCTGCSPPPAVSCYDTAGDSGDCNEDCENCETQLFDAAGQCGVGAFAPCAAGPGAVAPAPALGWRGLAMAATALVGAGVIGLSRRRAAR
jgi:hypothetical protein